MYEVPTYTINDQSANYCKDADAADLSVTIAGTGTYTVTWTDGDSHTLKTESDVAAGTYTYKPGTANAGTDTVYNVTITSNCGNTTTETVATIHVYEVPTYTINDQSANYCKDADAADLSVTIAGTGTYTVTWTDGDSHTLKTESDVAAGTYTYKPGTANAGTDTVYNVTITSNCGNTTSETVATIHVYPAFAITNSNPDQNVCLNAAATDLTVGVTEGSAVPTYQWYADGAAISGATTNSYTPMTDVAGTVHYTVKVNNGCGSDSVDVADVNVWTLPTVNVTTISRETVACMTDTTAAVSDTNALAAIGFHFANGHNISQNVTVVSNTFTGDNCFGTRTTVYRATDECGNSVDVTYIQTVKDTIAPVMTGTWPIGDANQNNCLANANLSVFLTDADAKAQYTDCSNMTVTHTQDTAGDNCGWTVRRMYVITDQCGNISYDTITVSGRNMDLPTITAIDDQDAIMALSNCQYKIPALEELTLAHSSDACGGPVTFVSQVPAVNTLYDQTLSQQTIPVTVTVENECGLQQTAVVNVIVPANDFQLTATDTAFICPGGTATLTADGSSSNGNVTYEWTPATGLNTTEGNSVVSSPDATTAYTVRATDRNGCFLEQEVVVFINPSYSVTEADSMCAGGVYEYQGLIITEEGTYTQMYTSIHGCDSIFTLNMIVKPAVTIDIERIADCEMSQYVIIATTNGDMYEWSSSVDDGQIDAQRYSDTIRVAPYETTTYTFTADRNATHFCTVSESITVNELLIPTASINVGDQHISPDAGGWYAEDVSENGDYGREWYVNGEYYFDQSQTIRGIVSPETSETAISIRLIAFSEFCSDTAEAEIPIVIEPIYVPNIFTPGEATNNLFGPEGDVIKECEMWIYSREGLLVFHSTNKEEKWDGTHQGKGTKCKQAAYTYKIKYRIEGQNNYRQKFGTVTLMR